MSTSISFHTDAVIVVVLVLGHTSSSVQTWITGARTLLSPANNIIIIQLRLKCLTRMRLTFQILSRKGEPLYEINAIILERLIMLTSLV